MVHDPLNLLVAQAAIIKQTIEIKSTLTVHYRHDLPGEIKAPLGLNRHLLTFFLTNNPRQVTRIDTRGEYDGAMSPGDFYLYPAGCPGSTVWDSVDKTLHFMIEPAFLEQLAQEPDFADSAQPVELPPVLKLRDPQITQLAQLFLAEMNQSFRAQTLYLDSLSTVLGIHLLRHYSNLRKASKVVQLTTSGLPTSKLRLTLEYIQAHLESDLSLSRLAQQVGLSRAYFAKQFKQSMQTTPHQYVNQQRVSRAKQLLANQDLAIAQIAVSCGFSNQSHLTKVFRQQVGVTPKAYRDRL